MKKLIFVIVIACCSQQILAQKAIKVWLVRHAEKEMEDPQDQDPELSAQGKIRADDLMKTLKGQKIDSIFVTPYLRTKLTGFPLADRIGLSIKQYDPDKQAELAEGIKKNAAGKNILIIGHSNTLLPLIEAFGAKKPLETLTDNDYDYLFELTIKGDKVNVATKRYGEKHHQEEVVGSKQ